MKVIKEKDQLKQGSTIYVILDWKKEGLKVISESFRYQVFGLIIDHWKVEVSGNHIMVCHDVLNPGVKFEVDEKDIYFQSSGAAQEACDHMNGVERKNTESTEQLKESAESLKTMLDLFSSSFEGVLKNTLDKENMMKLMPEQMGQQEKDLIDSLLKSVMRPRDDE
jgi:hypothetical protein